MVIYYREGGLDISAHVLENKCNPPLAPRKKYDPPEPSNIYHVVTSMNLQYAASKIIEENYKGKYDGGGVGGFSPGKKFTHCF